MEWTWNEINDSCLAGSSVACDPEEIVYAFQLVDRSFGCGWIEDRFTFGGAPRSGACAVLEVISAARLINTINRIPDNEKLLEGIRRKEEYSVSEAMAIFILQDCHCNKLFELEPEVIAGSKRRKADFRCSDGKTDWIYVEVSKPSRSAAYKNIKGQIEVLLAALTEMKAPLAMELFLRNELAAADVGLLLEKMLTFASNAQADREDIEELGFLMKGHYDPVNFVFTEHPGEPYQPRITHVRTILEGPLQRTLAVRYAYTDKRAREFIRSEARQLPKDAPTVIMLDVGNATGAAKRWGTTIQRLFEQGLHTRISGVYLFSEVVTLKPDGSDLKLESVYIENLNATFKLPRWAEEKLTAGQI